jgi:septal ring factor EnvC (AmiA/AmiB activator)
MLAGLRHIFKLTRSTVVVLVVVCTLGFNLLTFAFAPLANLMLTAAQRIAIQPAVAAASELATARDGKKAAQRRAAKLEAEQKADQSRSESLRRELEAERGRANQLAKDRAASEARVKQLQADLDVEKRKATNFADELTLSKVRLKSTTTDLRQSRKRVVEVTGKLEDLRNTPRLPNKAVAHVDRLTARIVQRSGVNDARNLASMPLESVPVVGALTIVSVTALEVHDACQTAVEMEELRRLANLPDVDASIVRAACAKIPTLGGLDDLTLAQCREHESKVLTELGPEAAAPIKNKCDCFELPDGCPDEETETVRVPPPKPELP